MKRLVLGLVLVSCAGGQRAGEPDDDGSFEVARGGFAAHQDDLDRCWRGARRDAGPSLETATVRVSLSVATDGSTSEISVTSEESGYLAACVRELVERAEFPKVNEATRVEGYVLSFE